MGSKLPSLRMTLGFFLHHHLDLHKTVRQSSDATISEIAKFWHKARIPIRDHQNCQTKLEKIFETWRLLKKNKGRQSATQQSKENTFVSEFDNLFDVAHANALNMMTIAEDKDFLTAQREKGRRGSMSGVDNALFVKEEKTDGTRQKKMTKIRRRMDKAQAAEHARVELASSTGSDSADDQSNRPETETSKAVAFNSTSLKRKRMRGTYTIITSKLAAALDRTKVSDRKATFVIAETVNGIGKNIGNIALNRSSIRRKRMEHRAKIAACLKADFQDRESLVLHWDSKLLPDLIGKSKIERLVILVSGNGVSQLLAVAKLPSGTGEAQATAVFEAVEDWRVTDRIKAMCFDTTNSNTGKFMGACVRWEQMLGREVLSLACRHHVMELIIGAAFKVCMAYSPSPDVLLFKRFQAEWVNIEKNKYETGIESDDVLNSVQDIRESTIEFAINQLEKGQPRDDYREFLELSLIFLGVVPSGEVRFKLPGPMHHARWMSKVIYSLKTWMFRAQFYLTKKEEMGLRDVCIFAVRVYLKAWNTAPESTTAPHNDFLLLTTLLKYSSIHEAISKATLEKLAKHLWYFSESLVGLALFDSHVNSSTKRLMVRAMNEQECNPLHTKKATVILKSFRNKKLEDFVTTKSVALFQLMDLPREFLQVDPDMWEDREDFKKARVIVWSMKVVNDHAERGVALIQEFNKLITKDESQLQYLLQVVEQHRKAFPDSRKQTLTEQ